MLHLYYADCRFLSDLVSRGCVQRARQKLGTVAQWKENIRDVSIAQQVIGQNGPTLAECLTRSLKPDYLVRVLAAGYIDAKKPT